MLDPCFVGFKETILENRLLLDLTLISGKASKMSCFNMTGFSQGLEIAFLELRLSPGQAQYLDNKF